MIIAFHDIIFLSLQIASVEHTHTEHQRINYDFAGKLWISARNEDRVAFACRMKSHAVPNNRWEIFEKNLDVTWPPSFVSFIFFSIFQQRNPMNTMHSRSTQKNATSRASTVSADSSLHIRKNSNISIERHYRIFRSNKTHGGSQWWRHSFARQFNANRIVIVWVFLRAISIEYSGDFYSRHADNNIINWKSDLEWYLFCSAEPSHIETVASTKSQYSIFQTLILVGHKTISCDDTFDWLNVFNKLTSTTCG